jgi:hypothetical protein
MYGRESELGAISGTNTGDQDLSSFATNRFSFKVDKVVGKVCHQKIIRQKKKLVAISGTNTVKFE